MTTQNSTTQNSEPQIKEVDVMLKDIRLDPSLQPRDQIDDKIVSEYAEDMRLGGLDAFPAVDVFDAGSVLLLADGFHRYKAVEKLGHESIRCRVHAGTKAEARWFACGSNLGHGLRRSTVDKMRAVICSLKCDPTKSNAEIARHVKVDDKTVGKYRGALLATSEIPDSAHRVGGDGRRVNTTNIGRRTSSTDRAKAKVKSASKKTSKLAPRPAELPYEPVSNETPSQPTPDLLAETGSWDELQSWLQRRIDEQGPDTTWAQLQPVLVTLGFPIGTSHETDTAGAVSTPPKDSGSTPSKDAADTESSCVLVQDWVSIRT